jgi:hypothetical protein
VSDFLKLAGSLPADENRNGLDAIAAEVVKDPTTLRAVIVLVDCKDILTKADTGDRIATLRIRRIEPIGAKDADAGMRLYRKAFERRTGKNALPIDLEGEVDAAFGGGEAS